LALFYRGIMERSAVPEFEECKTAFREALAAARKGVVPIEETETDIEAQGAALLRLFYDGARESPPVVLAVEYPFAVELNHPTTGEVLQERLIGGMDLVVQEAGRTTVVEHKTASRKWSQDQVRHDLQITCYRLAAAKLGMGEVGLRVQQLVKTKTPSVVTVEAERGERDINDLLCIIVGILGAVDAQAFFPVRSGKCLTCPFRRRCASE
jgi:putative RecB family exonuclease